MDEEDWESTLGGRSRLQLSKIRRRITRETFSEREEEGMFFYFKKTSSYTIPQKEGRAGPIRRIEKGHKGVRITRKPEKPNLPLMGRPQEVTTGGDLANGGNFLRHCRSVLKKKTMKRKAPPRRP